MTALFAATALPVAAADSSPSMTSPRSSLFAPENLLAWCIVPFDNRHRTPTERMEMLQRLGFTQYVWDWRDEHLKDLPEEIRQARAHNIRLRAIWLWVDATNDRVGQLGSGNRTVLDAVQAAGLSVEFWVGVHPNFFEGLDDSARVQRGAAMMTFLRDEAARCKSTIALYNHGDWFGEPENEIRIIEAIGDSKIGLVFNFHHAHTMIDDFPRLLPRMLPHLRAVNLNGMRPEGPKILPIGTGTREEAMIRLLVQSGYRGPIGILGHVEDVDIEDILRHNLAGLQDIARRLDAASSP
jgi:sugar phosphate isomerase/epimerase